jgi:DNA-binding CsgD family transcriptional regulator
MNARRSARARDVPNAQRGLFGSRLDPDETEVADSIPKAVARCRWIAMDIGAEEFGLYFVGPSIERTGLQPCFDSSHPLVSPRTTLICGRSEEGIVKHTRFSTAPCWWADGTMSQSEREFLRHPLAERTDELTPGIPGIVFPVFADRGKCGLVIFFGARMAMTPQQLIDAHARCFSLFHAVATFGAAPERQTSVTPREIECLKLTAEGYTSDQIAGALKLSPHTANQYLTNCTQKLNAVNRAHAVAKAIKSGLID